MLVGTLFFACAFGLAVDSPAGRKDWRPRDPATYRSPDGCVELYVDPTDREANGGSNCRCSRDGSVVWARALDFTFWDASVANDGVVAGWAYPTRADDRGHWNRPGFLRLVVLDPTGSIRATHEFPRASSRRTGGHDDPFVEGALLDPAHDRWIARVSDPIAGDARSSWWVHRLDDLQRVDMWEPWARHTDAARTVAALEVELVRGTPLIACRWWLREAPFGRYAGTCGVRFELLGPSGESVWSEERPYEYEARYFDAREELERRVRAADLLRSIEPSRFEVALLQERVRVTYAVEADEREPSGWSVREVARAPFDFDSLNRPKPADPEAALRLAYLGAIELDVRGIPSSGAIDTDDPGMLDASAHEFVDASGRILLAERETHVVHVFDRSGRRLAVCRPTPEETREGRGVRSIAVSARGDIHIGWFGTKRGLYAVFDSEGHRLGARRFEGDVCFQPGTERVWTDRSPEIELRVDTCTAPIAIRRRPNGRWLTHTPRLFAGPDGSLAIVAFDREAELCIWRADGTPRGTWPMVPGGLFEVAYSGTHVFAVADLRVRALELSTSSHFGTTLGAEARGGSRLHPFWCIPAQELWFVDGFNRRVLRYHVGE